MKSRLRYQTLCQIRLQFFFLNRYLRSIKFQRLHSSMVPLAPRHKQHQWDEYGKARHAITFSWERKDCPGSEGLNQKGLTPLQDKRTHAPEGDFTEVYKWLRGICTLLTALYHNQRRTFLTGIFNTHYVVTIHRRKCKHTPTGIEWS